MPMPNPLSEEQIIQLEQFAQQIPEVIALVTDCEECEIQVPGLRESLERNQRIIRKLLKLFGNKQPT